mmetsp:Transcript_27026/g.64552  ORF Transcript_27026/g.64552 Transcript_27026/m.64552 type:complete len:684 (+) Transcript_27026:370-2421(+)
MDAARAQRQAALEEKKKRLEELKARRQQRSTTGNVSSQEQTQTRAAASANLDEYIDGLLQVPNSSTGTGSASADAAVSTSANAAGQPDVNGGASPDGTVYASSPVKSSAAQHASASTGTSTTGTVSSGTSAAPVVKTETFEMSTQTADDDFPPEDGDGDELENDQAQQEKARLEAREKELEEDALRLKLQGQAVVEEAKILTAEEVEKELSSKAFSSFLNATSKKVERVLGSDLLADLLVDYDEEGDGSKRSSAKMSDGSKFVSSRQIYECSKWTATRDVTDMDWSPLHRELMLCGYHMPSSASNLSQSRGSAAVKVVSPDDTPSDSLTPRVGELLSDGLALIWNLAMPSRPEHIFTCGSPVTTTKFHPTESPLILGGCQSGQVVVWDIRAGRMPVQKSSLTTTSSGNSKGHTRPIGSMEIIEGGSGLVTASCDGRVNFWSLANLRDPAESLQIGDSVACVSVAAESESLLCADEMGSIYTVQSPNSTSLGGGGGQRSRRQVRKLDYAPGEGHFGMVTSLASKTAKSAARAGLSKGFLRGSGGLFLSTGVDWTVKMWAPAYTDKPLLSLVSHSYDYMSDVQWSPAHPSLMATASSNGTIGLWNFAHSVDDPITGSDGIVVEADGGSGRGLNKLKWSSDGRRMLVASSDRVHVLVLSEDVVRQKGDEDQKMMAMLTSRGLLDRE